MKSVKVPWYQKPILHNNKYINVQKSSMFAALFSIVSSTTFSFRSTNQTTSITSSYPFSPFARLLSTYTVWVWQLREVHTTAIISYRTSLCMSETIIFAMRWLCSLSSHWLAVWPYWVGRLCCFVESWHYFDIFYSHRSYACCGLEKGKSRTTSVAISIHLKKKLHRNTSTE